MKTAAFSAAELRFGLDTPGPGFVGLLRERARRSPARGFQRFDPPLGGRPKADCVAGSFARRSGKADHATRTSSRRSGKADNAARTSSRRSAKADNAAGLCPGEVQKPTAAVVFPQAGLLAARAGPAAGRTARFLITRGKASFYETATFRRRKVSFCSPFCGLLFCPARAKLALPAGEKPAARNPGRPAAARPTTATGSRFLRRQRERPTRRPRPSPPAREGSLGAPNDRTFPPGAERKARKEKGKEEPRMKRAPPL